MPRINKIQYRRGTSAAWEASNPVLLEGEPAFDTTGQILKIGDGVTPFLSLPGYAPSYPAYNGSAIIGVEWDTGSTSPALRYIDINGNTVIPSGTFWQTHPIFSAMVRVRLDAAKNEVEVGNGRGDGITLTSDYIMTRIPRVYVKCGRYTTANSLATQDDASGRYQRWWISPTPATGFVLHPAFYQEGFTTPANTLYIGSYDAYDATTVIGSKSGQAPYVNITMSSFYSKAQAIGSGWGILDIYDWGLLQWLFYIRFGTLDSQGALGQGRSSAGNPLTSGSAQGLLDVYGNGGGTNAQSMAFYGIENLWGNVWQFIIGMNFLTTGIRVVKPDGTGVLAETLAAGSYLTSASVVPFAAGGIYPSAYYFADPVKYLFIPSTGTPAGSSSTYLCDGYWAVTAAGTTYMVLAGGHGGTGARCGVGCLSSADAVGNGASWIGARLRALK